MGDSYGDPQRAKNYEETRDSGRGGFKGGRGGNNREGGGFRIRLSDNEMRAVKTIQEAFNLRSTVAVLGFSLRTLGQMIEEGKIDDIISQHRSQTPLENFNKNQIGKGATKAKGNSFQTSKPNPFARPEKPEPDSEEALESEEKDIKIDSVESDSNKTDKTINSTNNEEKDLNKSQESNNKDIDQNGTQSNSK